jgi:hypothetical protein
MAVKNYTSKQLLDKVMSLSSYDISKGLPKNLIIAVRSNEDTFNVYDDKMYVFLNGIFQFVTSCTTNPGGPILTGGWKRFNKTGAAVLKSDEVYYDAFIKSDGKSVRHHKDKMPCLRQVKNMKYFRDGNSDKKTDEIGQIHVGNFATNVHLNSYNFFTRIIHQFIGEWSAGCQVLNVAKDYTKLLDIYLLNEPITYVLLKEF